MKTLSNQDLTVKRIVILGGSAGIGLATAKAAADEGAEVIIVSGNQQRIDDALAVLPGNSSGYAVDLSSEENIKALFQQIGSFDHLVYSAGENLTLHTVSETDLTLARQFFNVRYWGALAAVKYAAPLIKHGGSINLTGGIAGLRPGSGWAIASSICGAIDGLTRALAVELAPIRVNSVVPGVIRTGLWDSMPAADREKLYTAMSAAYLVKRIGEPEDIAMAHIYLMKQQFTTGQNLVLDGGAVLI